jgi:MoaA/NifB/PqqE/SkfB family radical SAM enzyme
LGKISLYRHSNRITWGIDTLSKDSGDNKIINPEIKKEYDTHRPLGKQKLLCYAPFKNMYFGISGNIRACCRNESYIFGTYPQQMIKEIWNDNRLNIFRNKIIKNDLSCGCDECYEHLTGRNFSAVVARMFDNQKMNRKYPSVMEFELDNTCNLECKICAGRLSSSIRKNREKLPPIKSAYDSDFVAQLKEFIPHLEEARFYGGEPFLIRIYYEVWDLIIKINPRVKIYVQTNGTILNDRIKQLLEAGRFIINVSLDAMDKEVFEKLRVNAKFDSVMENLMYLYHYTLRKGTFFCVTPTLMRENWQELPELIRFCNRLNIPLFYNTLYRPEHLALYAMNATELEKIGNQLKTYSFEQKTGIQKQNAYYYSDFINLIMRWKGEAADREKVNARKILSAEAARIMFLDKMSRFFDSNSNDKEWNGILKQMDLILGLFENEHELANIYNKLLEIPVPVIIEQIRIMDGLDDDSILKMVRNNL